MTLGNINPIDNDDYFERVKRDMDRQMEEIRLPIGRRVGTGVGGRGGVPGVGLGDDLWNMSPMSIARSLHGGGFQDSRLFPRAQTEMDLGGLQSDSMRRQRSYADVDRDREDEDRRMRERLEEERRRFFDDFERDQRELFEREKTRQREHWKILEDDKRRTEDTRKRMEDLQREAHEDMIKNQKLMEKMNANSPTGRNKFAPPPPPLHPAHAIHNPREFDTHFPEHVNMPVYHPYTNPNHPAFPPLGPHTPLGGVVFDSPHHSPARRQPVLIPHPASPHAHIPFGSHTPPVAGHLPPMHSVFPPGRSAFHHYPRTLPDEYRNDSEFHPYGTSDGVSHGYTRNDDIHQDPITPMEKKKERRRMEQSRSFVDEERADDKKVQRRKSSDDMERQSQPKRDQKAEEDKVIVAVDNEGNEIKEESIVEADGKKQAEETDKGKK